MKPGESITIIETIPAPVVSFETGRAPVDPGHREPIRTCRRADVTESASHRHRADPARA
jgi:hypothetical protein